MAKIESVGLVGVFTRNQKKARDFYTKKLGLVVREAMPEVGYLALGATKTGRDAALAIWQPDQYGPEEVARWEDHIGEVTGIGFRTANLDRTLETLKRRKVKVEGPYSEGEGRMVTILDPDGNGVFLFEAKAPVKRPGLAALDFVTVASRDAGRAGEFLTKSLGLKGKRVPGEGFREYRLEPRGTAIVPFTPQRSNYENASDYDDDLGHIGEETSITFVTKDLPGTQDLLLRKGVRFKSKAKTEDWGGMSASFYDPDDNVYGLIQPTE